MFASKSDYPEQIQKLDPYYRDGFTVTAEKLKTEFRNLRSQLMKGHANWKRSGQGEKEVEDDHAFLNNEDALKDKFKNVYSSNFIDFCRGDMPLYYLYCACIKYDLLYSTLVSMPVQSQHNGKSKTRIYKPDELEELTEKKHKKELKIAEVLQQPVTIEVSEEIEELNRIKRQKVESETYSQLQEEYIALHRQLDEMSITPFLINLNKSRMARLEKQLEILANPHKKKKTKDRLHFQSMAQ